MLQCQTLHQWTREYIAQLVEHCSKTTKAMDLNPVWTLKTIFLFCEYMSTTLLVASSFQLHFFGHASMPDPASMDPWIHSSVRRTLQQNYQGHGFESCLDPENHFFVLWIHEYNSFGCIFISASFLWTLPWIFAFIFFNLISSYSPNFKIMKSTQVH